MKRHLGTHQENMELMKAIGSKEGYNPMPPSQHLWQMAKDQPQLMRMWSGMTFHTLHQGQRSPFAVKVVNGRQMELHMEHMAADLEVDEANAYHVWKQGEELGLWANVPFGSKPEKVRGLRRLYFRGDVPAPKAVEKDKGRTKGDDNCMSIQFP